MGFPAACAARPTTANPGCRFEVEVHDNDRDQAPSAGDFFSIKLSTVTALSPSEFPVATVFYARAGFLGGGNVTVK